MAPNDGPKLTQGRSGKDISRECLAKVKAFLDSGSRLPVGADGSVNMSALAELVDVPRQSLYKNPSIKALLEQYRTTRPRVLADSENASVAVAPDAMVNAGEVDRASEWLSVKKVKTLERRVSLLEQQNAALVAENSELRRQLKALRFQMGREDMAIETGRRIPAPPNAHD